MFCNKLLLKRSKMEAIRYIYQSGFKCLYYKVKILAISKINLPGLIEKRKKLNFNRDTCLTNCRFNIKIDKTLRCRAY